MKKLLVALIIFCGLNGVVLVQPAIAATNPFEEACAQVEGPKPATCNETGQNDPISGADGDGVLIKATRLVAMLTGIASVIAIIMGGIEYTISGGDPAKLNTAKNTIIFAVVGLIIAMTAGLLLRFVLQRL